MINALTIDLEYWHSSGFLKDHIPKNMPDQILESTTIILNLLNKYNTRATFFVLGVVAEKYPGLIESIHEAGHEVASHGYSHEFLHKLTREDFERGMKKSTTLLRSITGERPLGFRAPYFSINQGTAWALDVLKKLGYRYDSSIFPVSPKLTRMYGVPNAPFYPYYISSKDIASKSEGGLIEFPASAIKLFGLNVPVAGGFYMRLFPSWFLKYAIRKINHKNKPAISYIHPWEIYRKTPRLNLPISTRFVTYQGIRSGAKKFEGLLRNFRFRPAGEVLADYLMKCIAPCGSCGLNGGSKGTITLLQ